MIQETTALIVEGVAIIFSSLFSAGVVYGAIRRDLANNHARIEEQRKDLVHQRRATEYLIAELHARINKHVETFHTVRPEMDRRVTEDRRHAPPGLDGQQEGL